MGHEIVVEYTDRSGEPQWIVPPHTTWDYTVFGRRQAAATPDETIALKFEKIPGGRGGYNRWTINGKSWPDTSSPCSAAGAIGWSWTTTAATSTPRIYISPFL